jgi:alkanesulfonate monooxygenase SsuD/methylene tetrahydromethanopterin reductase-like flavin-dependent oxidoreductase (luciferase family)
MLRLLEHEGDMDFLISETPSVMVGDPDDFIKRIRQLQQMGIDEILLRIDGIPHEDIMRSIELIGREVMPAINGGAK